MPEAHGSSFSLPITDPVLIFALAMVIFLVAPFVIERFKAPGLVGIILSGAVVGPNGLNLLERGQTIVLLGTVGLIYLMFLAGVEIDLHGFRRYRSRSVGYGVLTFLVPQTLGTGAALALGLAWPSAILLGALLSSHTLLAYPLAVRLGISKNEAVVVTVGATMITDTAALLVLAVVASSAGGELDAAFWLRLGISLVVFVAIIVLVLPRIARWFFRHEQTGATATFVFVMTALFAGAYLAELAGVEAIVGAFLVGLALNRLIPSPGLLINRIHFVGEAFFIPFFLLSVGMLVDVRVFVGDPRAWLVMGVMLVVGVVSKWIPARLIQQLFGYSAGEGGTAFGLSLTRASATLAIALIGHDLGLFDDVIENGVILLMLVTSIAGPVLVEKHGRALALQEELRPYEPAEAPARLLVPLSNPKTAPALMDLALLLRDKRSTEPLYALTVVPEEGETSVEYVANAEKMLSHAVAYAAGADVSVLPLTRIDQNFSSGIARAVVETRTTTLVVGWDGRRVARQRMFGSVLDQLLEQTKQLVIVATLGHPLNTTKRIVIVLPPGADHATGFFEAASLVKRMANRLTASISLIVVDDPPERCLKELESLPPDVPIEVAGVRSWSRVFGVLQEQVRQDDLIVVLSARRDTVAWHPYLERAPARLVRLVPHSFLMVYPALATDVTFAPEVTHWMPHALSTQRVVPQLDGRSARVALEQLLKREFPNEPKRRDILRILLHSRRAATLQIAPGVAIPHARLDFLDEPLLFLGVSPGGVHFQGIDDPAHLVFLVLSPTERANEHLAILGDVARLCAVPSRVQALRDAGTVKEILDVLRSASPPAVTLAG